MPSWASELRDAARPRVLLRGVGVVVLLNALFLLLLVLSLGDPAGARTRARAAFASGDLDSNDFLSLDSRRGVFQYTDCMVLHMLAAPGSSRLERAIAPIVYVADDDWKGQCVVLRRVAGDDAGHVGLSARRYSRYWHGYNAGVAIALRVMDVRTLRRMLVAGVWIALAVLTSLMWRGGEASRRVGVAIAIAAALFWAVPYFDPGFTFGFGDAAVLLGLATLAARPSLTLRMQSIVPFAAGFGAVIVFFEMLTGQLPVAAAWLMASVMAARHDRAGSAQLDVRALAMAALLAFVVGAGRTVVIKQVLAVVTFDPGAGGAFLSHLASHAGAPDPSGNSPGMVRPFSRLWQRTPVLTHGSQTAGHVLAVVIVVSWIVGVIRAWRDRGAEGNGNRVVLLFAALTPLFWVLVLPNHTVVHAVFMVRMLVASVALAPLAALWPAQQARR